MNADIVTATKAALGGELEIQLDAIRKLAEPLTEAQFWRKPIEPGNSFGHLVLHLTGNLSHFALHRGQLSYIARFVQKGA